MIFGKIIRQCFCFVIICATHFLDKSWDTNSQLKLAKSHWENSKQELSDYKEKAARILQVSKLNNKL